MGNKVDIEKEREVTHEEARQFAMESGMLFFETSALAGHRINEAFLESALIVLQRLQEGSLALNPTNGVWMDNPGTHPTVAQDSRSKRLKEFVESNLCCASKGNIE